VQVHPDHFHFSSKSGSFQLRTFIIVKRTDKKSKILSVGEEVARGSDIHRIDLFQDSGLLPGGNRTEVFAAFLRYAVYKSYRRRALARPLVIVKGAQSLDEVLLGYQYDLLQKVFGEAGALKVRFE